MTKDVVIKSNRYGMELILNDQLPFPELLRIIGDKFRESGDFFKNAKMAVTFTGRELSQEEAFRIVDAITENSTIRVVSIMERGGALEARMKERVEAVQDSVPVSGRRRSSEHGRRAVQTATPETAQIVGDGGVPTGFYKGNLRSGQVLECPCSVTLIGDVNPGARIESAGNVVVLGALKGNACAGSNGDNNCFIFALDMQPIQLQIGEFIAKSPDKVKDGKHPFRKEKTAPSAYAPQVATAREGTICIEPMTKGCLDKL